MTLVSGTEYLRDPAEIYRRSFSLVEDDTDLTNIPDELHALAVRLVHACGDPRCVADLAWSDGAGAAGRTALAAGAPILVDAGMVAQGITRNRLPARNPVICTLGLGSVAGAAQRAGTTRSAAAVELWQPWLDGAVVAIGNAPTALFHLLEKLQPNGPKPALILGFPVGYVGAAEAKATLIDTAPVPYIATVGRRGGSALAAAAVNALAIEAGS